MEVSVVTERAPAQRVLLRAENCRIKGSDIIENLKLDDKFCMAFETELTWRESAPAAAGQQGAAMGGMIKPNVSGAPGPIGVPMTGELNATLKLDVWSEVIPPFNLLPREVLVSTARGRDGARDDAHGAKCHAMHAKEKECANAAAST